MTESRSDDGERWAPHVYPVVPGPPEPPVAASVPGSPVPYAPQQYVMVRKTSGMATGSLVLGIIGAAGGWCMLGIPCLVAILLGHVALTETRDGTVGGHGQAVAGLILGYLFIVPWVFLGFWVIIGSVFTTS